MNMNGLGYNRKKRLNKKGWQWIYVGSNIII